MKILVLFLFFITLSPLYGQEQNIVLNNYCPISSDNCAYYLCKETNKQCGFFGYYISYAYRYCTSFQFYEKYFSKKGKAFSENVRRCLQEEDQNIPSEYSCNQVKKYSFKNHIKCYANNGFCDLGYKDMKVVMKVIRREIFKPRTLFSGISTLRACYRRKRSRHHQKQVLKDLGIK